VDLESIDPLGYLALDPSLFFHHLGRRLVEKGLVVQLLAS